MLSNGKNKGEIMTTKNILFENTSGNNKTPIDISYHLTVKNNDYINNSSPYLYGIDAVGANGTKIVGADDISTDKYFVENLVKILNYNRIPIVHFYDVVEDMIDEHNS